ncbi:MAG: Ig-like domain-containing protein, partial [Myxococcota bacterium]|nr:Ig-like domain-containing protein [Myxococcota bacterium]
ETVTRIAVTRTGQPDVALTRVGSTWRVDGDAPADAFAMEEVAKPNGAPVAVDDHSATFAGEVLHVEVRRNDTDPDDDELSIVAVTDGAFGTVAITDGGVKVGQRVTYTPNDAVSLGIDSFTYTIEDPEGLQDTATVTIHQIEFQDDPVLTILSPAHGEVIDADTVTISFEVAGCYFTSPSVDPEGCHGHKWVDDEKWSALSDDSLGHYNTSTFELGPLTDGLHVFEFVLHDNAGSDAAWDPEITAQVSFEINGGYIPPDEPVEPVEVNVPILSVQPAAEAGQLLMGTTNGVWRTQGEDTALAVFFGPTVTALARDPFSISAYHASGQWPAAGYELWGLATSMNGGESWAETGLQNTAMFDDLAVGTDQPGFIAGVFASQVHLSADAGITWETTPLSVWVDDLVFASTDPVVLYLAG